MPHVSRMQWLRALRAQTAHGGPAAARPRFRRPRLESLEDRTLPSTYTVINADDSGAGSLRQAILDANLNAGTDLIEFNITGTGVHTIQPLSALPTITDPVTINGYTQKDAKKNTLAVGTNAILHIELDGTNAGGGNGLTISAGNSTVRGLVINRFNGSGIRLTDNGDYHVEGNFIGSDPTGTIARPNNDNGIFLHTDSPNNTIGGTTPEARNLISGNNSIGIHAASASNPGPLSGLLIQGNLIGTNAAGTGKLPNSGGVLLKNVIDSSIGGATSGAGNVISGNFAEGLIISGNFGECSGIVVQGNFIGTTADGTAKLGNDVGIAMSVRFDHVGNQVGTVTNVTIGGTTAAARNVISGNSASGISTDNGPTGNFVQGNYIGTDVTGSKAIPNSVGILLKSSGDTIGGAIAGAGNVISGNASDGLNVQGKSDLIEGNLIGTNAAGDAPVPNRDGVHLSGAKDAQVGGTTAGARNIISGNSRFGVLLDASGTGQKVQGNFIGTDVTGKLPVANDTGIGFGYWDGTQNDPLIGGTDAGAGNLIAFNSFDGAWVGGNVATHATLDSNTILSNGRDGISVGSRSLITRNAISANGGLGINLFGGVENGGVTANDDGDADTGPNGLQNYPVLTSASSVGGTTTVAGTLDSTPNATFRLEFFASPTDDPDPSNHGEGKTYLDSALVTTDGAGHVIISVSLGVALPPGQLVVSATATLLADHDGNPDTPLVPQETSEFSKVRLASRSNEPPVADDDGPYSVPEGGTLNGSAPGVLEGDTDAEGEPLSAILVTGPAHGSLTLNPDGSFSYQHDGSETTSDSFTYMANDGTSGSNVATVAIGVTTSNDAPVFTSQPVTAAPIGVLYSYAITTADPDGGDVRTITGYRVPAWLTVADHGDGTATLSGTPRLGQRGPHLIGVEVRDAAGATDTQVFFLTAFFNTPREAAIAYKAAGHTASQVAQILKDEFRQDSFPTARLLRDVGYTASQTGQALVDVFNHSANIAAIHLKWARYTATQTARALADVFGDSATQAAARLKEVGYTATQTAQALVGVFGNSLKQVAMRLRTAGYTSTQSAVALVKVFRSNAQLTANALRTAGYTATENARALVSVFAQTLQQTANKLRAAGYTASESARALVDVFAAGSQKVTTALKMAGYSAAEVGQALVDQFGKTAQQVTNALKAARFSVEDVLRALIAIAGSDVDFELIVESLRYLKAAKYTATESLRALDAAVLLSELQAAEALKAAGHNALEITKALKDVIPVHEIVEIMIAIGFTVVAVVAAVAVAPFGLDPVAICIILSTIAITVDVIAAAISVVYGLDKLQVAQVLVAVGFVIADVADAVITLGANKQLTIEILKAVGYTAVAVVVISATVLDLDAQTTTNYLKVAGYDAYETAEAWVAANVLDQEWFRLLKIAGYLCVDVAFAAVRIGTDAQLIPFWLKVAGYLVTEVAEVCVVVFELNAQQTTVTLKDAQYEAEDLAQALRTVYGLTSQQTAEKLWAVQIASREVAVALLSVYALTAQQVANDLKAVGYSAAEMAQAVDTVFNLTAQRLAQVMTAAGCTAFEVADALITLKNQTCDAVIRMLKAGHHSKEKIAEVLKHTYGLNAVDNSRKLHDILGFGRSAVRDALVAANYGPDAIADALRHVFGF